MDKYAIISSARDSSCYHIVETRFIYKTDENGVKPITAEDLKFDDLFVRKIGLHLNGVSIIDTNDNPYDLRKTYSAERRIRMQKIPQYSPKITLTKKSGKEIKKPNSQNNALRAASQEADNHFHNMLSLTTTNEPEETEEDEETEETEETEIRAENESRMDIEINITVIGDVRITAEKYATILQATTMRKRANCILKLLWKPEELESMYVKTNSTDASQIKINADDRKKVLNLCLYMQKKRELKYADGSSDDIKIYLKKWMGEFFKERRRQNKRKS